MSAAAPSRRRARSDVALRADPAVELVGVTSPGRAGWWPRTSCPAATAGAVLPVAGGHVVEHGVPGDRGPRLAGARVATGAPMTTASSASQSIACEAAGSTMSSSRPDQRPANFAKSVGYSGSVAAHLQDVGAVVEPDADDLPRRRDERGEPAGRACGRPVRRGRESASRVGEQRAQVGCASSTRRRRATTGRPGTPSADRSRASCGRPLRRRDPVQAEPLVDRGVAEPEEVEAAPRSPAQDRARTARRTGRRARRPRPPPHGDPPLAVEHLPDGGRRPPPRRGRGAGRAAGGTRCASSAGRPRRWSGWCSAPRRGRARDVADIPRPPARAARPAPRRCAPSGRPSAVSRGRVRRPIGRSPGWPHSRSVARALRRRRGSGLVGPELEEGAARVVLDEGMSSPSIQAIGRSLMLWWPWQPSPA